MNTEYFKPSHSSGQYEETIPQALEEWKNIVGVHFIHVSEEVLSRYSRSSAASSTKPLAVLQPDTLEQVQAVVKVANKYGIPIYPISRGNNWGYGDACAVTNGQVIVDLRRMNRILEINTELAYAVVEPGVTQGQLSDYLKNHDRPLIADMTGAGPDTSIVGNVLERGFGHTPIGDHALNSAGYEVVLANGEILRTGFGHYEHSKCKNIFKAGIGPALDGLFTQSNLGVVTQMTVYLLPKPKKVEAFVFSVKSEAKLLEAIDALRPLRLDGIIHSTVHIINDLKAISSLTQCPAEFLHRDNALTAIEKAGLRRQFNVNEWSGFGGLYGSKEMLRVYKRQIKKALKNKAQIMFLDETKINSAMKVLNLFKGLHSVIAMTLNRLRLVWDGLQLLQGVPVKNHMLGAGWKSSRKPVQGNMNPLDNQWGSLWLAPIIPMTGSDTQKFLKIAYPIYEAHGFDPILSLSMLNHRTLCCVMAIAFNKDNAAEGRRAEACYRHMLQQMMANGYVPYRAGIQSMDKLRNGSKGFWNVASQIKEALDPRGVIAPGRYL